MGLGNFFQSTPIIKLIKAQKSNVSIDVIGGSPWISPSFIKNNFPIRKIHLYNNSWSRINKIKFFWNLRRERYDKILIAMTDESRAFRNYFLLINSKATVVMMYTGLDLVQKLLDHFYHLKKNINLIQYLPGTHEIDMHYNLYQSFVDSPIKREYETINISNGKEVDVILEKFNLKNIKYIVVAPSARSGMVTPKLIPPHIIKAVIKHYSKFTSLKFVGIGTIGDNEWIKENVVIKNFINIAGNTTIEEAAIIMKNAICNILPDSGSMHIAHSVKANIVAVYGPTDFYRTRSIGDNVRYVHSKNKNWCIMFNNHMSEVEVFQKFGNSIINDIKIDDLLSEIDYFADK